MKPCEPLAKCRQNVKDCEPEGTYLDGKAMLLKHVCKVCGRVWAEVYLETRIIVDLTTHCDVHLIHFNIDEQKKITEAALIKMLEHINALKVSDRDGREDE